MRLRIFKICAISIAFILMASIAVEAKIVLKPEGYFEEPFKE